MVHRIVWRVGSGAAIDFWEQRLREVGVASERDGGGLRFADPEGLEHELVVSAAADALLIADAPDIPREHALQGFDGVRAYAHDPARSAPLLRETLGFTGGEEDRWEVRGEQRGGFYAYDRSPPERGFGGAGTVHHVAWATTSDEHAPWRERVAQAGAHPTPVIDRFYFRSVYFREPSGVLFELATLGPGFATDEPEDKLGERLSLPPAFEHLRERLEPMLTPLPNPRSGGERSYE